MEIQSSADIPRSVPFQPGHILELDALRGVAALVVVFDHFHQIWLETSHPSVIGHPRRNPLLWAMVDGHASVILFFLLSAFVLTLPYLSGRAQPYPRFAFRRICRIYPPYGVAIIIAIMGCAIFHGRELYGVNFHVLWRLSPDRHSIMQHLMMLGRFDIFRYDVPVWSLVHEMRISLVFPLIIFVSLRLRAWSSIAAAVLLAISAHALQSRLEGSLPGTERMVSLSLTLSYCGIFLLGAAFAQRRNALTSALAQWPRWAKLTLLCTGLTAYLYGPLIGGTEQLSDLVIACGGLVLIAFVLQPTGFTRRTLRTAPMQFLGRVSYSLYLLHLPILLVLSILTYRRFPYGLLLVPYVALYLLAAAIFYRFVELPSIEFGRRLGRA